MSASPIVPMFDPQGVLRDVPFDKVNDFKAHGGEIGVRFSDPDGAVRYAPASKMQEVAQHGGKILPIPEQAVQHPGFWASLGSDLAGMVKGIPHMFADASDPSGQAAMTEAAEQGKQMALEDPARKAAGYSVPYRITAPVGEFAGVNVPGIEQSAKEGDMAGVAGHAAAVPVVMAASEGAARILPKAATAVTDAAPKVVKAVRDVTPKQAAQVVAGGAGAVGGHGTFSVPAATASAHYMGNIVESILGKERANAPIVSRPVKPVYPGAHLPENPGVFPGAKFPAKPSPELLQSTGLIEGGKTAPPEPSAGLGQIPVRVEPKQLPAAFQPRPAPYRAPLGSADNPLRPIKTGEVAPQPQAASAAEPGQGPSPTNREPAPPSEQTLSGESALRRILTGQDNANLLKIAKSRGINVTQESQLKPGVADNKLINKIIENHSEEELQNVRDMYLENSRFKHSFGDIGPEAWKALSMQSYFPDVKISATVLKRMESAVRSAKTVETPTPEVPKDAAHMTSLAEKSLEMLRKRRAIQNQ